MLNEDEQNELDDYLKSLSLEGAKLFRDYVILLHKMKEGELSYEETPTVH